MYYTIQIKRLNSTFNSALSQSSNTNRWSKNICLRMPFHLSLGAPFLLQSMRWGMRNQWDKRMRNQGATLRLITLVKRYTILQLVLYYIIFFPVHEKENYSWFAYNERCFLELRKYDGFTYPTQASFPQFHSCSRLLPDLLSTNGKRSSGSLWQLSNKYWFSAVSIGNGHQAALHMGPPAFSTKPVWRGWMNKCCFRLRICICKAILGRGQPRLIGWILLWIMPMVQNQSLDPLTSSPVHYHCAKDAPLMRTR